MLGVRVPAKEAESVKKELMSRGILDTEKKARRDGGHVIFPVLSEGDGFETVEAEFRDVKKLKSFRDALSGILTPEELLHARRAFDVIGDIAIIEMPEELEDKEEPIAKVLLSAHKNIRSVYKKTGRIMGDERTREFKFLCGEDKTETIYREHGMTLKLDIRKVYFSPRLSKERERILELTGDGEVVVDLFSGIGPFSILLAKYRRVKAYAIDSNPHAFWYLKENIRINKVADQVVPLLGDCKKVAPRKIASRVIMNLPKSSSEFLDLAFEVIEEGVIHYYAVSPEEDLYGPNIVLIERAAERHGKDVEILGKKKVRPYSPYNYHVAIDVGVK